MQVWAKVVFRIFRDVEPVGEGVADGGQVLDGQTRGVARTGALAARWLDMMLAVKLSFRASWGGVVSLLLFGALVGIGGKCRKIKRGWREFLCEVGRVNENKKEFVWKMLLLCGKNRLLATKG
jgi:hypothetical protein